MFPPTPCSGLVALGILLQLFCAGLALALGSSWPGLPAWRGLCRALAPGPSSQSTPRVGMDTMHLEQQLEGFLLVFSGFLFPLKSFFVGL